MTSDDNNKTTRAEASPARGQRADRAATAPTAVLDSAHMGDIEGAFGRISLADTEHPRTIKTRLMTLLAIVGPGIIVMVGDNHAGGGATYAPADPNAGYSLSQVVLLWFPA